jgi:PhnB protein
MATIDGRSTLREAERKIFSLRQLTRRDVMKTNLHLTFQGGRCAEAFAFYERIFRVSILMSMAYQDAPPEMQARIAPEMLDKVMHCAMPLGSIVLMGCDAPLDHTKHMGGFQISVDMPDEAEVRRVFAGLSEGGSVQMPLAPTFWSPLFGMCTDRFGVAWMVSVPGPM